MRLVLASLLSLIAASAFAQPANSNCATASQLCAQQAATGNNTGANGAGPVYCQPGGNQVWYTFTTNSVGGTATVSLNGINCPLVGGMDNELSMAVLSGSANCNPANFGFVGPCETDSMPFSITTQPLTPNTQYWVVVSGAQNGGAITPAQCDFGIDVSGPGVDVIGVDFSAGPDAEIAQGGAVQLDAFGGTTYDWSPTSGLSGNGIPDPIANPSSTTTYAVTTTINGCTYTDTVVVDVVRLVNPPNTFTPNSDGRNDAWEIPGIQDYPGAVVMIYDRWGQRVFNSNGYREPWDGTRNGRPLSEGTYYYYIELNPLEGRSDPYTGYVSIIR
ncbi:MAG: gliding motility-associated C-terminal domain-containing protein [Flavobacteriales bacterium]|jgi:gliding motility-associated-like protein|nr:gliding motility-associated C-terminal domain-containing protein [Flavobacteriales bacterium]